MQQSRRATPRVPEPLRAARTYYDHLADRLGVAIVDALLERGHVRFDGDGGEVTTIGQATLKAVGIMVDALGHPGRRSFCRPCLDWTERRHHLTGEAGAVIRTC